MDTEQLAKDFMTLFTGLDRVHGEYKIPMGAVPDDNGKIKGKATTLNKPVTKLLWEKHLSGELGLGITPIREDGTCMWGCIDLDHYDDFDHAGLEKRVTAMGLPLVVCRTKSAGCHLYMFLVEPTPAKLIRTKLHEFEMALGYINSEIFPKQDKIESDADFGNWVNMPYHKAMLTMRFAFHNGKAVKAEDFVKFARDRAVTIKQLEEFKAESLGDDFADAPPCLQHLVTVGFPKGSMNNALFSMGVYARKKYPDDWEEKVSEYNTRFMGPGSYKEVQGIIRSLSKKSFIYKCTDQPICAVCNKKECLKREHGIGKKKTAGSKEQDDQPCILEDVDLPVTCYLPPDGSDDEPQWVFKIGGKQLDVSIDMMMNQQRFLREYLKKFQRLVLPVKETVWADMVNDIMKGADVVALPPDAGPEGQFMLHLERFCTGKVQGRAMEDLFMNKPFTDIETVTTYFRSQDLMKYLDQQHFRDFKERQLWAIMRKNGAGHDQTTIKGKSLGFWFIKSFKTQNEDLTVPDLMEQSRF